MKRFNPCGNYAESEPVVDPPPPEPPVDLHQKYAEQGKWREILFTRHYGQPDAPRIIVPYGMMAVHLSVKFDNSDIQTDYFDRHANLSPDFVLLVVKRQAETERLARKGLALCPELADLKWKWHTEKYSMGHGNYLESSGFELPEDLKNLENGYRSGGVTHGHWEIEFSRAYRDDQELKLLPHNNYECLAAQPPKRPNEISRPTRVTLTENSAKNGLELRFPDIPSESIRAELKAAGWRWSRFGGCWYIRDTEAHRQFATSFVARVEIPAVIPITPTEPPALPAPFIQLPTWRQRFLNRP